MSRTDRRSQMAVMPCARHGEASVPYATKVSSHFVQDITRRMPTHAWALGAMSAVMLFLSGCTFADQNSNNGKAAPPSAAAAAAQPTGPTPMDTFRALAPPEGMKFTPLFAVPVKDDGQRFARLEQSVQALRNDFDTVTPTLVRLAAVEKDIRDLVSQLRTLDDSGPIVEAVPVAPVASAPVTAAVQPTKPVPTTPTPAPVVAAAPAPKVSSAPPASNVTAQVKPQPAAPQPQQALTPNTLPGRDVTGGTEAAPAVSAVAGKPVASLPVTPEAAPTGKLPPAGAASPSSTERVVVQAPKPVAPTTAPAVVAPPVAPVKTTPPPLDLTPVLPEAAQQTAATPPAVPAAAPVPQDAPKVVMGAIVGDVRAIRIGDHIDKTRIVLDVTAKAPFKVRLENEGRRVIVELPQYAWKADASWRARSAALVSSYQYANGALVLDLLAPATVRQQVSLPAGEGAGPRVMIDLFAPLVHVE